MLGDVLQALAQLTLGPAGVNADSESSLAVFDISDETELAAAIRDEAAARRISSSPEGEPSHLILVKTFSDAGREIGGHPGQFKGGWQTAQTIVPAPTEDWLERRGQRDPAGFGAALAAAFRLDEDDPEDSWIKRHDFMDGVRTGLDSLGIRSLRFQGAGGLTDLTVPLAASSVWNSGRACTRDGVAFAPNLPCEEVFAAPDWRGVCGTALITRTFNWGSEAVEGGELTVKFNGKDGVEIPGAPASLVELLGEDLGAVGIGEVALVDSESAAAKAGVEGFGETILDENCASHLAFGCALPMSYTDPSAEDVYRTGNHLDFVIGTADMVVTATTSEGEFPLLDRGQWAPEVAG